MMGQTTLPSNAFDLSSGNMYIKAGKYTVGATGNATTDYTGTYDFYTTDTTANCITIESGAGTQEFNLWRLNSNCAGASIITSSGSDLILNVIGTVTLTSSSTTSGAIVIKNKTAASLTINGDSLNLISLGYGIGSSAPLSMSSIDLHLNTKYLNITTPTTVDRAISSRPFQSISIADSCLFTAIGVIYGNKIVIGKSSVKVSSMSSVPVNKEGDSVYCVTVPRNGAYAVTVKNNATGLSEEYTFTSAHPDDSNYYLYLPDGSYTLTSASTDYSAEVSGSGVIASLPSILGDGVIDVSAGAVTINEDKYQVGVQAYTYSGRKFTFSGTSTEGITINGGADEATFNGVDIRTVNGCAFNLNTGKDFLVILEEGTVNTLISTATYAALQKSKTEGMLTISGKGTLNAIGGGIDNTTTSLAAPAIGSAYNMNCANITIEDGIINASAGSYAPAIGAGRSGTVSHIYIKGGVVMASNNAMACTIGNSYGSSCENIVISGGLIKLSSGNNSTNDAYLLPLNVTITGGTIVGRVEHETNCILFNGGVITGGSMSLFNSAGITSISDASHPTNGVTTDKLYYSRFVVPGITEATKVTSITVDGKDWGCNDMYTTSDGLVYLWLAKDDASQYEVTTVVITVNGKSYTYGGQIDALDELVAKTSEVVAQGNYFYQVPVHIATTNATVAVTDADNNVITEGSLLSSGLLDDNKPRIKVSAIADQGYGSLDLSLSSTEEGSLYYKVITEQGDTLTITAKALLTDAITKTEADNIVLYGSNKLIVVSVPRATTLSIYSVSGEKVGTFAVAAGSSALPVSVSGLYVVKVSDEDSFITKKCRVY